MLVARGSTQRPSRCRRLWPADIVLSRDRDQSERGACQRQLRDRVGSSVRGPVSRVVTVAAVLLADRTRRPASRPGPTRFRAREGHVRQRHADRDAVAGLARAQGRAGALAPARGLGLQPLAPVRRGRACTRFSASRVWTSGTSCATTAARSRARGRARLAGSRRLAAALVAPRAGRAGAATARRCETARCGRSRRVISLSICSSTRCTSSPSRAWRRSSSASPTRSFGRCAGRSCRQLTIARLHGRSLGAVEALAIAVLRERVSAGVRGGRDAGGAGPAAAAPPAHAVAALAGPGPLQRPAADHQGRAARGAAGLCVQSRDLGDGRHVAYESYRQKLPLAVRFGEIAVMRADLPTRRNTLVSPAATATRCRTTTRRSRPTASGSCTRPSAGNQNFAKRYGRISFLRDGHGEPAHERGDQPPASARAPTRSRTTTRCSRPTADARRFQALRGGQDRHRRPRPLLRPRTDRRAWRPSRRQALRRRVRARTLGRRQAAGLHDGVGTRRRTATRRERRSASTTCRYGARRPSQWKRHGALAEGGRPGDLPRWPLGRLHLVHSRRNGAPSSSPHDSDDRPHDAHCRTGGGGLLDPVVARNGADVAYTSIARSACARAGMETRHRHDDARQPRARQRRSSPATETRPTPASPTTDDGSRSRQRPRTSRRARPTTRARSSSATWARASTHLVSDPSAAYPRAALARVLAKAKADGPPAPATVTAPKRPDLRPGKVAVTDNAFFAGTDRPTLRVGVGQTVTWAWLSRQSHSVTCAPAPSASPRPRATSTRSPIGSSPRHLRRCVCALHAPGMRMTVVVR